RHALVRDVGEAADTSVASCGAEILVSAEINPGRAGHPFAHVVVCRRDDLVDATAGFRQFRQVAEIDGGDFCVLPALPPRGAARGAFACWPNPPQSLAFTRRPPHFRPGGDDLRGDPAADLTGRPGHEH